MKLEHIERKTSVKNKVNFFFGKKKKKKVVLGGIRTFFKKIFLRTKIRTENASNS
jgi:hypothetical protein